MKWLSVMLCFLIVGCAGDTKPTRAPSTVQTPEADTSAKAAAATELSTPMPEDFGLEATALIGRWKLVQMQDMTNQTFIEGDAIPAGYFTEFKQDGTFVNFDGSKTDTGTWQWRGNKIALDNSVDLTILLLTPQELAWEFYDRGRTWRFFLQPIQ